MGHKGKTKRRTNRRTNQKSSKKNTTKKHGGAVGSDSVKYFIHEDESFDVQVNQYFKKRISKKIDDTKKDIIYAKEALQYFHAKMKTLTIEEEKKQNEKNINKIITQLDKLEKELKSLERILSTYS